MELKEALEIVVKECKDPYAQSYAKAALELGGANHHLIVETGSTVAIAHAPTGKMMVGRELKVQILYVLCNLSTWRGERAKEVKKILKEASK